MFEDIPMLIDETLDKWIPDAVAPESRDSLQAAFSGISASEEAV